MNQSDQSSDMEAAAECAAIERSHSSAIHVEFESEGNVKVWATDE